MRMLAAASRKHFVGVVVATLLRAILPTGVILATGLVIGAIPDAVTQGFDSPAGDRALVAMGVLALSFVAAELAGVVAQYLQQALTAHYEVAVYDAVAASAGIPAGIDVLEQPEVAAELTALREYDRDAVFSQSVASLLYVVTSRIRGIAGLIVLLPFGLWPVVVLAVGWLVFSRAFSSALAEGSGIAHQMRTSGLRRALYLRSVAVDAAAAKEVRIFGLAPWVVEEYSRMWLSSMRSVWRERTASAVTIAFAGAALLATHGLVFGFLAAGAHRGDLSVAALVVYVQAVLATEGLAPLGWEQWIVAQAVEASEKVTSLTRNLRLEASVGVQEAPSSSGAVGIDIEEVTFSYRSQSAPILDRLTLSIPAGQSLAIVGANGCGKTTLIKLICGLYHPEEGRITFLDAAGARLGHPRVAAIFQDFIRYELPLRDNVGLGSLDLIDDDRALEAALRAAGAPGLSATLAAGLDTVLTRAYENGAELSGGQWQKVALARAMLALQGGAGLLILDEPAASLDVRAEAELFDRLVDLRQGSTSILVTHRLSTVRRVDRIVVLDGGGIVEDGTHDELMAVDGRYASMFRLQAERFSPLGSVETHMEVSPEHA